MRVRVVVPLYLPKTLDYAWAGESAPQLYQVVAVPVGTKTYHGMVTEIFEDEIEEPAVEAPAADDFKLEATTVEQPKKKTRKFKLKEAKPAEGPDGDVIFPTASAKFYEWVSRYNFTFPGEGLRAALQAGKLPPEPTPDTALVYVSGFDHII